jgi:hypothetical protein
MPLFIAEIKLLCGTLSDYNRLSEDLRQKSFRASGSFESDKTASLDGPFVMATDQPTLFEVSSTVSAAASRIGKKFSFTVRRERN